MQTTEPHRIPPARFVRHSPLDGKAYVHLDPIMLILMEQYGSDVDDFKRGYEKALRSRGLWPADLPPAR